MLTIDSHLISDREANSEALAKFTYKNGAKILYIHFDSITYIICCIFKEMNTSSQRNVNVKIAQRQDANKHS